MIEASVKTQGVSSDYYVRITLGRERYTTRVVLRDLEPRFDECFMFSPGPTDLDGYQVIVRIMRYNGYTSDGTVGEGRVPVIGRRGMVGTQGRDFGGDDEGDGCVHDVDVRKAPHLVQGPVTGTVKITIKITNAENARGGGAGSLEEHVKPSRSGEGIVGRMGFGRGSIEGRGEGGRKSEIVKRGMLR